jgi:hypothetical protein
MAETMLLAMEERYECYSLGREISLGNVEEMAGLAAKHGFRLSGFRAFERVMTDDTIRSIKKKAYQRRSVVEAVP